MEDSFNLIQLGAEVVNSRENVINWCEHYGLVPFERQCSNCKQPMSIRTDQVTAGIFRCRRCNGSTYAVTANTWFYDMDKVMLDRKSVV